MDQPLSPSAEPAAGLAANTAGPVIDPVCGMAVTPARAAASAPGAAGTVYFCSAGCRDRFLAEPDRYAAASTRGAAGAGPACCDPGHGHGPEHGTSAARSLSAFGVPLAAGLAGALALLAVYFGILTLLSGWRFTLLQFGEYWPYITALAAGFGIQLGLFLFLRRSIHAAARTGKVVAATGATSGVAMLSCCTHYLVNLLPALGATGLASLVGAYQVELFWFGLAANLAGIAYMASRIGAFYRAKGIAGQAAMAGLVAGAILLAAGDGPARAGAALPPQTSNEGMVMVQVTPLDLAPGRPWRFEVLLNTHSVALGQDMAASTVLLAADGRELPAAQWDGDAAGGHHRAGILSFAAPDPAPQTVTLKIRGVAVPERVFTWKP